MSSNSAPMWANLRRMIAEKIWPVSEPTVQQDQQPQQRIVVPAYNPTRILGMARDMRTPRITCGPFYAWMHKHGQMLPPTHSTEPMARPLEQTPSPVAVSNVQSNESWLNSAPMAETPLATLTLPDWVTAAMPGRIDASQQATLPEKEQWQDGTPLAPAHGELFEDAHLPSQPLEDDGEPTEMTPKAKSDKGFNQAITGLLGQENEA